MIEDFKVLCHSSIRIVADKKVIYIDPFEIEENYGDADYICITHSHYDHFSPEDILKIKNNDSIILITEDIYVNVLKLGFKENKIVIVDPDRKYKVKDLYVETVSAYNIDKAFHPKANGWVGYILNLGYERVYIAGDTDITPEALKVKCDLAFIPVGGTYTMDYAQAAKLTNTIMPTIVVPVHYGKIVGNVQDAKNFKYLLNSKIDCKIMIQ
jgi:L-ascorbate metabolism protein UlaG (beta-lactamase superfamily)